MARELSKAKQEERDRKEDEWVKKQLEKAPPLTVQQTRMLRRLKTDLARKALDSRD
jgi:hypothetical protein